MKITKKHNASFYAVAMMLTAVLVSFADVAFAQSLSDFESAVETEASSFKNIAARVIEIVLVLGAIGVIYAYVTKRQDAKDYLIYYLIGIVVLGVLRTTVLNN